MDAPWGEIYLPLFLDPAWDQIECQRSSARALLWLLSLCESRPKDCVELLYHQPSLSQVMDLKKKFILKGIHRKILAKRIPSLKDAR